VLTHAIRPHEIAVEGVHGTLEFLGIHVICLSTNNSRFSTPLRAPYRVRQTLFTETPESSSLVRLSVLCFYFPVVVQKSSAVCMCRLARIAAITPSTRLRFSSMPEGFHRVHRGQKAFC
jgi:hypothetical protein